MPRASGGEDSWMTPFREARPCPAFARGMLRQYLLIALSFLQLRWHGIMDVAAGSPFDTANHQGLETGVFHGRHVMTQDVFAYPSFAKLGYRNDRLHFAAVLGID